MKRMMLKINNKNKKISMLNLFFAIVLNELDNFKSKTNLLIFDLFFLVSEIRIWWEKRLNVNNNLLHTSTFTNVKLSPFTLTRKNKSFAAAKSVFQNTTQSVL